MATLPSKFLSFRECSFDSIDQSHLRDGDSYHRSSTQKAFSQYFDIDLVTPPLDMVTAFELTAWLIDNTSGQHGVFQVANPFNVILPPNEINSVTSRSAVAEFAKSVPVQGLTPLITNAWKPGTFFNFDNHPKVYMITNSPNANGTGQATITFTPGLFVDVPSGTEIKYGANCLFNVSSKTDVNSLTASVSSYLRTPITIPARERDNS